MRTNAPKRAYSNSTLGASRWLLKWLSREKMNSRIFCSLIFLVHFYTIKRCTKGLCSLVIYSMVQSMSSQAFAQLLNCSAIWLINWLHLEWTTPGVLFLVNKVWEGLSKGFWYLNEMGEQQVEIEVEEQEAIAWHRPTELLKFFMGGVVFCGERGWLGSFVRDSSGVWSVK